MQRDTMMKNKNKKGTDSFKIYQQNRSSRVVSIKARIEKVCENESRGIPHTQGHYKMAFFVAILNHPTHFIFHSLHYSLLANLNGVLSEDQVRSEVR